MNKGYIYIRTHPAYDLYNACKLGKASNIPERDTQYATGEIIRGKFQIVFEVQYEKMSFIERILQFEFKKLNIINNAGTEFYNKKILELIEPTLNYFNISFNKLG